MFDWGFLLHTLVVYTVVGSGMGLGLFLIVCRCLKINNPVNKRNLLLLVLAIPLLATLYNYFLLPVLMRQPGSQCVSGFFANLCSLGKLGSNYYLPLLLLILFGLYRGLMYWGYQRKICRWNVNIEEDCYRRPLSILNALVEKAGTAMPKIRIVAKPRWSCFTYGILRPTIVISQQLLMSLDDEELEGVLAHELGHINHRDSFWKEIGASLRDLSFYMPFVHWVFRTLQDEQELAADDFAINLTGKPLVYGATLIKAWRKNQDSKRQLFPVSAFARGTKVSDRVLRVINHEKDEIVTRAPFLLPVLGVITVLLLSYIC